MISGPTRRQLLGTTVAGALAAPVAAFAEELRGGGAADDDGYWRQVAAQYDLPPGITQLENGNWGAMARPVFEAYQRLLS